MTLSQLTSPPYRPPADGALSWQAPFVGRTAELAALIELLGRADRRWVTLTGRSGVGKTRLLGALDSRLALLQAHVIVAAPLTGPVGDGLDRVAHTLGIMRPVRSLAATVAQIIGSAPTILVLDDATSDGAPGVATLLDRCPRLKVVAASIVALGLPGETPFRLGGLDPGAARELFVERAGRTSPNLALEGDAAVEIEQICARLHGIPLDLEIAAAQVRTLGTRGVARHLTERATGRPLFLLEATVPSTKSVGSAVALSYARVGPTGQRLLRALSVFHGPFTVEQVRAVQLGGDDDLVDSLTELVDAWLVEPVPEDAPNGEARFVLAPVIRGFAEVAATESGERPALLARHADHHAALARHWALRVDDAHEGGGLRALVDSLTDLFAAAEWYLQTGDLTAALRVAADLAPVALSQGSARAVSHLLFTLLAQIGEDTVDEHVRGDALVRLAQARLHSVEGEDTVELAMQDWSEGLRLLRLTGDQRAILRALAIGAQALPVSRDLDRTQQLLAEGVELSERLGHVAWRARFEVWSGMVAHQMRLFDEAWRLGVSTLVRARRIGDRQSEVSACLLLIPLVGLFPEPPGGVPTPRELLALCESMHDASLASLAMGFVAEEALGEGDTTEAARWIATRLSGIRDVEAWRASGYSLMLTSRLAAQVGERDLAVRMHGALLAMLPALLAGCPPRYADRYTHTVDELRSSLGDAEFDRLTHEGSLIPWADAMAMAGAHAVRLATVLPGPAPAVPAALRPPPAAGSGALSSRERQVLELISAGLTNREIAERLAVTAKTVMHHSVAIYRKLDVRGRAEAVAWFVRTSG